MVKKKSESEYEYLLLTTLGCYAAYYLLLDLMSFVLGSIFEGKV